MRMTMGRRAYPSALTDGQWELLNSLIPHSSLEGRPPFVERREMVNGTLSRIKSLYRFFSTPEGRFQRKRWQFLANTQSIVADTIQYLQNKVITS
jgi:hypothetical protein